MNRSRISLARIPTPIECMPNLSAQMGIDLRIKRDDLTGTELSGNKVRKLEFLLADAIEKKCDSVITCGAITSNHARATAIAARKVGLACHLVLAGDPPAHPTGNLQLDLLVDARVKYISRQDYTANIASILQQHANDLKTAGKKPYIIPTGGSNAVGLWGYVEAIEEIKNQLNQDDWKPDYLVCAVGSGGTYAGIVLGTAIHNLQAQCLGVLVCGTVEEFRDKVIDDIKQAVAESQEPISWSEDNIQLISGYIGSGYAQTNSDQLRLIRHVAQQEAVFLDPVYTGKAFCGLHGEIQSGRIPKESKVLFFHTGGIFGLPYFSQVMTENWNSNTYWPDGMQM